VGCRGDTGPGTEGVLVNMPHWALIAWFMGLAATVVLFRAGQTKTGRSARELGGAWLLDALPARVHEPGGPLGIGLLMGLVAPSSFLALRSSIGAVNTGQVSTARALWIVFGAAWGATLFGVVAALFGPGLVLIGIGAGLLCASAVLKRRGKPAASDLVEGWGFVLLATAGMGHAFAQLGGHVRLDAVNLGLAARLLACAAVCALTTAVLRSPALLTCLVVFAAREGVVELSSGVAAGLGVLIGQSVPALRALASGTPNARRVAFGLGGYVFASGLVGALLITYSLPWLGGVAQALGDPGRGVMALQVLSLSIAAAVWGPLVVPVQSALDGFFLELENDPRRPRHIDRTTLESPDLAYHCSVLEIQRMLEIPAQIAETTLREQPVSAFRRDQRRKRVEGLRKAIAEYAESASRFTTGSSSFELVRGLSGTPVAAAGLERVCELLESFPHAGLPYEVGDDEHLLSRVRDLQLATLYMIQTADPRRHDYTQKAAQSQCMAIASHARALEAWLRQPHLAAARTPDQVANLSDRLYGLIGIAQAAFEAARDVERVLVPAADATPEPAAFGAEPSAVAA